MKKRIVLLLAAMLILGSLSVMAASPGVGSVTCTPREDGLSDVTVVVNADSLYTELTLAVIGSDDNGIGTQMTIGGQSGYVYYLTQGNTGASTSCTFNFTMDIPDSMVDIADYIYVFSGNESGFGTFSLRNFKYDVTFDIGSNGTVEIGGNPVADGDVKTVVTGEELSLKVTPADGYIVKTVTVGGINMEYDEANSVYKTGMIGKNSTVVVEFYKPEPIVSAYPTPCYEDLKTSIVFVTLANESDYELVSYGVVAGESEDITLETQGAYILESKTDLNSKGQYGIRIIDTDDRKYLGDNYFVKSYAVYNNGSEDVIYYGSSVNVTFVEANEE